ncbi:hypothetical protein [Rhizohabitans arisaemae]|uniref:hypothetical protein n=1 Tax=Rhizohabitans arisaemae TaxID=2720610 RepID=UPI0024B05788|nr:hypothetical protein [Rhizohabitans arisaemae]
MRALGILLMLAGAAAAYLIVPIETGITTISVFDRTYALSPQNIFLLGTACGVTVILGLVLIFAGARRAAVRRRALFDSRSESRRQVAKLEKEKKDLERKLEDNQTATPTETVPARSPSATSMTDRLVAGARAAVNRSR